MPAAKAPHWSEKCSTQVYHPQAGIASAPAHVAAARSSRSAAFTEGHSGRPLRACYEDSSSHPFCLAALMLDEGGHSASITPLLRRLVTKKCDQPGCAVSRPLPTS